MSTVDRQITINDSHKEKLCFTQFRIKMAALLILRILELFACQACKFLKKQANF